MSDLSDEKKSEFRRHFFFEGGDPNCGAYAEQYLFLILHGRIQPSLTHNNPTHTNISQLGTEVRIL